MAKLELMKMIGNGKPILDIDGFYVTVDNLEEYQSGLRSTMNTLHSKMKRRYGYMAESHPAEQCNRWGVGYDEFTNPMLTLTRAELVGYDYNGFKFSKPNFIDVKQAFIVCFNNTDKEDELEVVVHSRNTGKTLFVQKFNNENIFRVVDSETVNLHVVGVGTDRSELITINHEGVVGVTPVNKVERDTETDRELEILAVAAYSDDIYGMILGDSTRVYDNMDYSSKARIKFIEPKTGRVLCEPRRYSGTLEIKTGIKLVANSGSYYKRIRNVDKDKVNKAIENWVETIKVKV